MWICWNLPLNMRDQTSLSSTSNRANQFLSTSPLYLARFMWAVSICSAPKINLKLVQMFAGCFKELGRCMHTDRRDRHQIDRHTHTNTHTLIWARSIESNSGLNNSTLFLSLLTVPLQCQQQEAKWGKPMSCSCNCKLTVKGPSISRSIWIHNVIIWLSPAPWGIGAKYYLLLVFHLVF